MNFPSWQAARKIFAKRQARLTNPGTEDLMTKKGWARLALLTVTEAAKLLKTTRQNVHDAIARGRLPATRLGSVLVIRKRDLTTYAKSRKRTGRPKKSRR